MLNCLIAGCSQKDPTPFKIAKLYLNRVEVIKDIYKDIQSNPLSYSENQEKICQKIHILYSIDQEIRFALLKKNNMQESKQLVNNLDLLNYCIVERILALNKGWLSFKEYGKECESKLWVLVQHSPNLLFQIKVLQELERLLKTSSVQPQCYTYLFDRVAIRLNRKQRYGTQVEYNERSKEWEVLPVENKTKLNELRQKMGLTPLEHYLRQVTEIFNKG